MSDRPDPLVPEYVDLRDFAFMPLEVARLRRSKQWLIAKRHPEIGFYAVNLWMASWHEVPAASLETDDDVLADFAMCEPKRWAKVKADVLRGWVECSDGRLYHPVVAEKALESWERKASQRERSRKGNEKRWGSRKDAASIPHPIPEGSRNDPKRQGQGEGQKERTTLRVDAEASPRSIAEEVKAALFGPCLRYLAASIPDTQARSLIGKWRRDYGDVDAAAAIAEAEKASASQPVEFIVGVLQRRSANRRPDPNGPPRLATAI